MIIFRDDPDHRKKRQEATMENSLAHTKWDCVYHIVWIPISENSDMGTLGRLSSGVIVTHANYSLGNQLIRKDFIKVD
jgi:hypothetical protein